MMGHSLRHHGLYNASRRTWAKPINPGERAGSASGAVTVGIEALPPSPGRPAQGSRQRLSSINGSPRPVQASTRYRRRWGRRTGPATLVGPGSVGWPGAPTTLTKRMHRPVGLLECWPFRRCCSSWATEIRLPHRPPDRSQLVSPLARRRARGVGIPQGPTASDSRPPAAADRADAGSRAGPHGLPARSGAPSGRRGDRTADGRAVDPSRVIRLLRERLGWTVQHP
jgi:hypothetical protein